MPDELLARASSRQLSEMIAFYEVKGEEQRREDSRRELQEKMRQKR